MIFNYNFYVNVDDIYSKTEESTKNEKIYISMSFTPDEVDDKAHSHMNERNRIKKYCTRRRFLIELKD